MDTTADRPEPALRNMNSDTPVLAENEAVAQGRSLPTSPESRMARGDRPVLLAARNDTRTSRRHVMRLAGSAVSGAFAMAALGQVEVRAIRAAPATAAMPLPAPFSLPDRYRAVQALGIFEYLDWDDDLWSDYLQSTPKIAAADKPTLQVLARDQQALLANTIDQAKWLQSSVAKQPAAFQAAVQVAMASYPVDAELSARFAARVAKGGGVTALTRQYSADLLDGAAAASQQIALRLKNLSKGGAVTGDLPQKVKCALLWHAFLAACFAGLHAIAHGLMLKYLALGC